MIIDEDEYLEHYGIKGMKWGQRKARPGGVTRRVDREARKDAEELVRSKAYYGKGAGTRRKLINQTIAGKEKRIPGYREALDAHISAQDTSKHASKAVKERNRTDRVEKNKQRAGALARRATGEMGTQAAFVAAGLAGAAFLKSDRGQRAMKTTVSKLMNTNNSIKQKKNAYNIKRNFNL